MSIYDDLRKQLEEDHERFIEDCKGKGLDPVAVLRRSQEQFDAFRSQRHP
jgi:hypothetical protein